MLSRGKRQKYARNKVHLDWGSNSLPPGHESDTLTTEPPGQGFKFRKFWNESQNIYNTIQAFNHPGKVSLMKTLWEKKKMLVTSIFSFSHNDFNPTRGKFQNFDSHLNCLLQQISNWISPKFHCLEKTLCHMRDCEVSILDTILCEAVFQRSQHGSPP